MNYPATFELPTTDTLTGLMSAAYFSHVLRERIMAVSRERDEPLSVFLLDLDGFSLVNDTHGHVVGDAILRGLGGLLRSVMPDRALLVRYSGDELAGALPETRIDEAFTLLEDLRRQLVAQRFAGDVSITCSIGLAGFPAHGKNEIELMREADEALFYAKSSGRNRVALPNKDSRMITKTSYYTQTQLERLAQLARTLPQRNEASILREALDDVLKKYNDRLGARPETAGT